MKAQIAFDLDNTRKISFQNEFPKTTECCRCHGNSRLGFVAYENYKKDEKFLCNLYNNQENDRFWLHDLATIAVYFCEKCLQPTALYNQG